MQTIFPEVASCLFPCFHDVTFCFHPTSLTFPSQLLLGTTIPLFGLSKSTRASSPSPFSLYTFPGKSHPYSNLEFNLEKIVNIYKLLLGQRGNLRAMKLKTPAMEMRCRNGNDTRIYEIELHQSSLNAYIKKNKTIKKNRTFNSKSWGKL